MKTLHVKPQSTHAALATGLFKLERCGKYAEALDRLGDIWPDVEERPDASGSDTRDAAEILLRCGTLFGFYGHNYQIKGAQDRAKDMVSEARRLFLGLNETGKIAECENHLALAYWRTGEYKEARDWIAEALAHDLPNESDARLYSHVAKSLIDNSLKRYKETVENGRALELDFRKYGDPYVTGSFYTNLGIAYKNLDKPSNALGCFELAKYYHQRSRHKIYLATVENNLAQLYRETGQYKKAHLAIDNATRLFKQIKDKTREGFSLDTKALVFLSEANYPAALASAEKALKILCKSENSAYIVETALTKAKILLHLDEFSAAVLSLIDAVDIARVQTGGGIGDPADQRI